MGDLVEGTGLWEKKTKAGEQYFSGQLNGRRFLIFRARAKPGSSDKSPTHTLFWADAPPGRPPPPPRPEGYGGHDGYPDKPDERRVSAADGGRKHPGKPHGRQKVFLGSGDEVPF